MRVVLHRWIEGLSNEVLETRRIQDLLIPRIAVEGVSVELFEALRVELLV